MAELHHTWCRCNLIFKIYTHRNQIVPSRKNFLFRWKTKRELRSSDWIQVKPFFGTLFPERSVLGVVSSWVEKLASHLNEVISSQTIQPGKKDHSGSQFSLVFTFRMRTILNNGSIFLYFWNMKWGGTSLCEAVFIHLSSEMYKASL